MRILTADDYEAVRDLWEAAGLHIRPVGRDSQEAFARQLASGCQIAIGLEDGARLIGVVLATHDSRRGWINRLAVHPDYRRQGLGMKLVQEAERELKARDLPVLCAHIESWNEASQALFRRMGYVTTEDVIYFSKRDSDEV
jgi:ribosomal protein S18 acetylase RimI-like enzyme